MWSVLIRFALVTIVSVSASISCRSSNNASVDWFVGYKLPLIESDRSPLSGLSFLYVDKHSTTWSTPENINSSQSAIGTTLAQLYASLNDSETFYMAYNDEHPGSEKDSYRGHTKGVAVFGRDSGFWLVHSVPNFPPTRRYSYPLSGHRYGQSFLCITMKTSALSSLATQMLYIQPSIYLSQLPNEFAARYPILQMVIAKKSLNKTTKIFYSVEQLSSQSGMQFTSFAKHKKFGKDLYSDLVAHQLKTSLFTETWLNGPGDLPSSCLSTYKVNNIVSVNVGGSQFMSSKDHSKWAISTVKRNPSLCIGDINRQKSQWKRGGGTVCMKNSQLWSLYKNSVIEVEPCKSITSIPNWLTTLWQKAKNIFMIKN